MIDLLDSVLSIYTNQLGQHFLLDIAGSIVSQCMVAGAIHLMIIMEYVGVLQGREFVFFLQVVGL